MKVVIVGCGSIGARHARNAKALGASLVLCDTSASRRGALAQELGAKEAASIDAALSKHEDLSAAIIATPSSLHAEHALPFIEHGVAVFIEKPLATSVRDAKRLAVAARKSVAMIGQSYRFHEGLKEVKRILERGSLGTILHALYDTGQYLPDWHPKADYRKEYAARKAQGGGVWLTTMSHCLDTAEFLFGDITGIAGEKKQLGDLELEAGVDDFAECSVRTESGASVRITADFLDRVARHRLYVVGSQGSLEADFIAHRITTSIAGQKPEGRSYSFEQNARYVEELEHFFDLAARGVVKHELDLSHGAHIVGLLFDPRIKDLTV